MKTMKYKPKIELWPHQKTALQKIYGRESMALFMAMRTGKTAVVLAEFGQLEMNQEVRDLLVIAPGGVYRTWVEAMETHLSEDLWSRLSVHIWQSSKNDEAARDMFLKNTGPRVLLMNVEALSLTGSKAQEFCKKFLRHDENLVVVDESTIIKNKSKRTKFVCEKIGPLAKRRRILSGLATPRSPLDLFFQFYFLDWSILGHKSWYTFRGTSFCPGIAYIKKSWLGGRWVELIDQDKGENGFRPEAIVKLRKQIESHSYRVEFRPKVPSTYSIREVEMTKEQQKAYNEMLQFATTKLSEDAHVTATVVIAQIMRLHQILCGHVADEQGNEHVIPENKTAALLELLEDYDGKAVIWCSYDHDIRKVVAALEKEYPGDTVARFWGGNTKTREDEVKLFKNSSKCRFMVATPDSGGRGQTWDCSDLAVYYSSKDNLEHRDQSEMRTMGRDKTRGVDNVDLICPSTVEEKILHALRRKINMASVINGDNFRNWLV